MKRLFRTCAIVAAAAIAVPFVLAPATAQQPAPAQPKAMDAVGAADVTTLTAKIEAVDVANRLVTVKGPLGRVVTLKVDDRVKNLPQVKVGDEIVLKYFEAVSVALTKSGGAPSATTTTTGTTAPAGSKPGMAAAQQTKIVAKVESVDAPSQKVLLVGPRGNYAEVKVKDPNMFKDIKVGDNVDVTYTEAVVVDVVTPAAKNKPTDAEAPRRRPGTPQVTTAAMATGAPPATASLAVADDASGQRIIRVSGRLDATTIRAIWGDAQRAVAEAPPAQPVVIDASGVQYCDGAGAALFVELLRHSRAGKIEVRNLPPTYQALLNQFNPKRLEHDLDPEPKRGRALEEIGREAYSIWRDIKVQVSFIGQTTAALIYAVRNPASVRWRDVWQICERVGVDGLPIVALISFLLGLILAFQSAVPMKRFGAEIFVADLIGLAMLRELGPLMTAILLAGRSGAAFAAEIGTMRVNQEVDALTTMGLDPVRFLVTPRIIAALLMTPLLTVFSDLVGLIGGAATMQSFAIPFSTFLKEVDSAVKLSDFLAGFVKSFVFAVLVAGIGCLRGLQTGAGASAVGDSATRAVVSAIILLVVVDGVFAVAYYLMNI